MSIFDAAIERPTVRVPKMTQLEARRLKANRFRDLARDLESGAIKHDDPIVNEILQLMRLL